MAAAPIASTDLCQRGLHRVRVILVHLFAHLEASHHFPGEPNVNSRGLMAGRVTVGTCSYRAL